MSSDIEEDIALREMDIPADISFPDSEGHEPFVYEEWPKPQSTGGDSNDDVFLTEIKCLNQFG